MKQKFKIQFYCIVVLAMLLVSGQSLAVEEGSWRFNAYGTLGFSQDDSDISAFVRDLSQRPEHYTQTDFSWERDSRLGLQVAYQFSPSVEISSQIVFRNQEDTRPLSFLDWSFLSVHPTPDWTIHLGRVGYDAFLMSDHRNLGYAYPWVRPPVEFYGWVPLYSLDGVDIAYNLERAPFTWHFKGQAGHGGLGFAMGPSEIYKFASDQVFTLTLTGESGPWRVKAGYSHISPATEASPLSRLHAGLDAVAAAEVPGVSNEASYLRKNTSYLNADLDYTTLGVVYDDGQWLVQGELGRVTSTADMVTNGDMGYVGVARRFEKITPFAMLAAVRPHNHVYSATSNWAVIGQRAFQNVAIATLNTTRMHQETLTLGGRWDFDSHAAIKMQVDSTHIHPNGYGLWYYPQAYRLTDDRVNLFSMTLDFMF